MRRPPCPWRCAMAPSSARSTGESRDERVATISAAAAGASASSGVASRRASSRAAISRTPQDVGAHPVGLVARGARRARPRRRAGRRPVEAPREQRRARGGVRQLEHLVDQQLGLSHRQAAAHHDRARRRAGCHVATGSRRPPRAARAARGARRPARAASSASTSISRRHTQLLCRRMRRAISGCARPVLAVERAHEPRLLELGEPAPIVQLAQAQLRVDRRPRRRCARAASASRARARRAPA